MKFDAMVAGKRLRIWGRRNPGDHPPFLGKWRATSLSLLNENRLRAEGASSLLMTRCLEDLFQRF